MPDSKYFPLGTRYSIGCITCTSKCPSVYIFCLQRNNLIIRKSNTTRFYLLLFAEIKIHCTFRKISGAILVVGTGAILHKCSKLEDFVEAFRDAILPAAAALQAISEGSLCFTVQLKNKSALEVLWDRYRDGTLQRNLQQFLVTDDIKQLADGEEVTVSVYIDEQELQNATSDLSTGLTQGNQFSFRAFLQSVQKRHNCYYVSSCNLFTVGSQYFFF